MTRDWTNGAMRPSPEQLAAYADGELDAASRRHCAEWLAGHPEAAAEVETWRRLSRLWQSNAPEEPGPAVWAATLDRIEKSLPAGPPAPARPGRKLYLWASLLTAAAAAALAISLSARLFQSVPDVAADPDDEQPYPVAEAHEVAILSMDAKDADALVVGESPVHGPLAFADFEDIILLDAKRMHEDAPQPQLDEQLALPMIVPQPAPWDVR
jgi:anti-sigma factor RsiW